MSVMIYSANIGGRDVPRPQVDQDIDVEWRYFTDRPDIVPYPWKVHTVDVHENESLHPNMLAKWWKVHPVIFPPVDHAIWIDASMEITSPSFAHEAIKALRGAPVATWKHPRRTSIYDEAAASLGREAQGGRYASLPIMEQVESYRAEGYPDDLGLFACGTIVWTWAARALGEDWWRECVTWGYQDQLSFPVCCWRAGVRPATFPVAQIEQANRRDGWLGNRWLRIWPHTPGTD